MEGLVFLIVCYWLVTTFGWFGLLMLPVLFGVLMAIGFIFNIMSDY